MVREALLRFFRRQFFQHKPELGDCVKIAVYHKGATNKQLAEVYSNNFEPGESVDESVCKRLAEDIEQVTQDIADELQDGVQSFTVSSYYQLSGERPYQNYPLKQRCEMDEHDAGDSSSEPANEKGLVAYLMRQNEQLHRSARDIYGALFGTAQRQIARQADQIDSLLAAKFQLLQENEAIIAAREERLAKVRAEEARDRRIDGVVETFLPLIPAAVNMISGKKLLPEKTTPERQAVWKFLETIQPDQLKAFRQVLDVEEYGMVVTMLQDVSEGIDSNLPQLFRRFVTNVATVPEKAEAVQSILSMGQRLAIQTILVSFQKADENQAAASAAKENPSA